MSKSNALEDNITPELVIMDEGTFIRFMNAGEIEPDAISVSIVAKRHAGRQSTDLQFAIDWLTYYTTGVHHWSNLREMRRHAPKHGALIEAIRLMCKQEVTE